MSERMGAPIAWLLALVAAATMLFILAPLLVTVAISIEASPFVTFPPRSFTLAWYGQVLADPEFRQSLLFSTLLALGATAVGIGRPYIWGLGAFGQEGVEAVLAILRRELEITMRQMGTVSVKRITPAALAAHG